MRIPVRSAWLVALVVASLIILAPDGPAGASEQLLRAYTGQAQIDGALAFGVQISPPVSTPGDTLTLSLSLVNNSPVRAIPEVTVNLPPSLRVDITRLPPGATFNIPDNRLSWLPIVPPSGGRQELSLKLPVATADILHPEQRITAVLHHDGRQQEVTATFWIGIPPQAGILFSVPQASVGQPVQLLANSAGPGPFRQSWDLGDGRRIEVNDPTVAFPVPGTYRISLNVANPLATTTATAFLTVVPQPVADFRLDRETVAVNELVTFRSLSGGQPPLSYVWSFGDGSSDTFAEPMHIFTAPGDYSVRLVVSNGFGQAEKVRVIRVGRPPENGAMVLSETGTAGELLFGRAFGDDTVSRYEWAMGDGTTYDGEQVSHSYTLPGNYWVSLRAYNNYGFHESGQWVRIAPGDNTRQIFLPILAASSNLLAGQPGTASLSELLEQAPIIELDGPFALEPIRFPPNMPAAEQLYWYLNEARRLAGQPPLSYSLPLAQAAQAHTDDMALNRYTGHVGTDGSSPPGRILRAGYGGGYGGEVTYWGMNDPREAVEFWMNSPPHRQILLSPYVTEVGAAFTANMDAPNIWYWTAEFGSPWLPAIVLTPTPLPSATLTATATLGPSPTVTATGLPPTATPTPTGTSSPQPTVQPTNTPLPLVTFTPSPTPPPPATVTPWPTQAPPTSTATAEPTATTGP